MAMKAMKPLALIFFVVVLSCLAVMPATLGRTKADCGNLWKIVGGQGNSNELRQVMNPSSFVRLYEDCLRAEEGIRYRRAEVAAKVATVSGNNGDGGGGSDVGAAGNVNVVTQQPTTPEQSDAQQQLYRYIAKLIQTKLEQH